MLRINSNGITDDAGNVLLQIGDPVERMYEAFRNPQRKISASKQSLFEVTEKVWFEDLPGTVRLHYSVGDSPKLDQIDYECRLDMSDSCPSGLDESDGKFRWEAMEKEVQRIYATYYPKMIASEDQILTQESGRHIVFLHNRTRVMVSRGRPYESCSLFITLSKFIG